MIELESVPLTTWVWLGLIVMGLSLFFTAYYFRLQSKRLRHALSRLYEINKQVEQDAIDFFHQAWSVLESVGCVRLQADVAWFGESKAIKKGQPVGAKRVKKQYQVVRDDMGFEIIIYMQRDAARSESMAGLVITTFLHILEQNLVLKQSEILTSQKRLERYQLFVQHEIKNIAQFIQMLSEQVQAVKHSEDKIKLVERVATTLPIMAQRARKTIDHMKQPLDEFYVGNVFAIQDIIAEVLGMYSLHADIKGDVSTNVSKEILLEVFKNILGNFRDHPTSSKPLTIRITKSKSTTGQTIRVIVLSEKISEQDFVSERMFEPFWTTSESGMGLGLFLSRELLKKVDGNVQFYQTIEEDRFGFIINLPGLVTS